MEKAFRSASIDLLARWIFSELDSRDAVMGIPKANFQVPHPKLAREMFGHTVAAPLGVAAGPHTQLAQNIVAKGDLSPLDVQPLNMVQACADWLGIPQWSRRTANALTLALATPSELALGAILSPEYMVSA